MNAPVHHDDLRKAVVDSLSAPSEDIARHVLAMAGANPNQSEKAITTGTGLVAYDLQAPAKNLAGPILGACAAVLLLALAALWIASAVTEADLRASLQAAQTQADAATRDLATCQGDQDALTKSLGVQNASLSALKAQGEAVTTSANKAVQAATVASNAAAASAGKLLAEKPSSDLCASADALILETVK